MNFMDDQAEWDDLLAAIPPETPTREAVTRLRRMLDDAVQAHRDWATDRLEAATRVGLGKAWTRHVKSLRPKIRTKKGDVQSVAAVRRPAGLTDTYVQLPLMLMGADDLQACRNMHITNLKAASGTVAVLDRLIAPGAANPAEAADQLGLDIDAVMAGAA